MSRSDRARAVPPGGGRGFTLVELLVVVGIVAILISLLVVLVPRVRRAAQGASSQQALNALQAAIDQYFSDHRAYPGPLRDETVATGAGLPDGLTPPVTMSENLTLGLLGGLKPSTVGASVVIKYDPARVGDGAINLSAGAPSPPKAYVQAAAARGMLSAAGGPFRDAVGRESGDSHVPEFVDRYDEDPLPFLYLRARAGAAGVMSDAAVPGGGRLYQYDVRQITPYTTSRIGLPRDGDRHGLQELGDSNDIPAAVDANAPNQALRYFRQPEPAANPAQKFRNADSRPRQRDAYILIGAGPDRVYGTFDDITNFGPLTP